VSESAWEQYVGLAQRLDAVRAEEAARTGAIRAGVAEMSEHADQLEQRLREQGGHLAGLASHLRLRAPKLDPIPVQGHIDPAPALRDIAQAIDRTDREARRAAERGQHPALLPRWPNGMRNFLLYGVAAAAVLAAQIAAFYRDSSPNAIVVLFVVPLIGYILGTIAVSIAARPRVADTKVRSSPRLGLLLCFGIGPIAVAVLLVQHARSR